MQNWNLCTFDFFRSSQSETEIQTSLGLCDVMDYKIPLTQLLGSFRFIMLSPFLFECVHIHRPSQCSEAVLEQLSQITGSKIKQTWMCITHSHTAFRWICPYLQLPVSQQHNESNCEGGSVTDAQQQNHTESKSGLICVHSLTCSHFVTR